MSVDLNYTPLNDSKAGNIILMIVLIILLPFFLLWGIYISLYLLLSISKEKLVDRVHNYRKQHKVVKH